MFRRLLINNWKAKRRSPLLGTSVAQTILIGFLAVYFLFNFLVLGIFMDKILLEFFPDVAPITQFNRLVLYYFLIDIFFRFFLQEYPVLNIQPYLAMPLKRTSLAHFLLLRSVPTFFNILPLFILLPFMIKVVIPAQGILAALVWLMAVYSLVLLANFIGFYLKGVFARRPLIALLYLLILGGTYYFDQLGYLGLSTAFGNFIDQFFTQPYLLLLPLVLLFGLYQFIFQFIIKQLYLDAASMEQKVEAVGGQDFGFFSQFGKIGEMMQLEAKMMWRSKRVRTFFYMSSLFLLYPLLFINDPIMENVAGKLGLSIFVTGIFTFNYAQLLLSWHSLHFDFIITRNILSRDLFQTKYNLLAGATFVFYLLSIPYVFLNAWFFYTLTVSMLFNIGWGIFVYMYIANFNSKKIDPGKGGAFNMEGFGAAHYVVVIPIIALPILLYYFPFGYLDRPFLGLLVVGVIGLIGILFRDKILDLLTRQFEKRKHQIATDFRRQ